MGGGGTAAGLLFIKNAAKDDAGAGQLAWMCAMAGLPLTRRSLQLLKLVPSRNSFATSFSLPTDASMVGRSLG